MFSLLELFTLKKPEEKKVVVYGAATPCICTQPEATMKQRLLRVCILNQVPVNYSPLKNSQMHGSNGQIPASDRSCAHGCQKI